MRIVSSFAVAATVLAMGAFVVGCPGDDAATADARVLAQGDDAGDATSPATGDDDGAAEASEAATGEAGGDDDARASGDDAGVASDGSVASSGDAGGDAGGADAASDAAVASVDAGPFDAGDEDAASLCVGHAPPASAVPTISCSHFLGDKPAGATTVNMECPACAPNGWYCHSADAGVPIFVDDASVPLVLIEVQELASNPPVPVLCTASQACVWTDTAGGSSTPTAGGVACPPLGHDPNQGGAGAWDENPADYALPIGYTCSANPNYAPGSFFCYRTGDGG